MAEIRFEMLALALRWLQTRHEMRGWWLGEWSWSKRERSPGDGLCEVEVGCCAEMVVDSEVPKMF